MKDTYRVTVHYGPEHVDLEPAALADDLSPGADDAAILASVRATVDAELGEGPWPSYHLNGDDLGSVVAAVKRALAERSGAA